MPPPPEEPIPSGRQAGPGGRAAYGRTVKLGKLWRDLMRGRVSKRIIAQVIRQIARGIITSPVIIGVLGPFVPRGLGKLDPTEEEIEAATRAWNEAIATGTIPPDFPEEPTERAREVTRARGEVLEQIGDEERRQIERDIIEEEWQRRFGTPEEEERDPVLQQILEGVLQGQGEVREILRDIVTEQQEESEERERQIEESQSETERRVLERIRGTPTPAPAPAPPAPSSPQAGIRGRLPLLVGGGLGVLALGLLARRRSRAGRAATTSEGASVPQPLTSIDRGGVSYYPSSPLVSSTGCPVPRRKKPGKCLERAPVNWAGGRYKGRRAGTKCIRWKR
jgi:hypothetical protein